MGRQISNFDPGIDFKNSTKFGIRDYKICSIYVLGPCSVFVQICKLFVENN